MAGDVVSTAPAAAVPVPVPASVPAPVRPSVGDIASRLGEVTVLTAAILYGLGAFSVLGQLRRLDLHQPSVLSGFAHEDVLMKGVGVLLTNIPNLVSLTALVTFAMSIGARAWLIRTIAPNGGGTHRERLGFLVCFAIVFAGALLVSTWWGGTAGIVAAYGFVLFSWLHGRLLTPSALIGTAAAGSVLLGMTGTYLYPVPLPQVEVQVADGADITGRLLGTSRDGELYVVVEEDGERHVRVVESGSPAGIRLDDPREDAGRVIDRIG